MLSPLAYLGLFVLLLVVLFVLFICSSYVWDLYCRKRDGYWIEYFSPFRNQADEDDFSLIYHEGENSQGFGGKIRPQPRGHELLVLDEAQWQKHMPSWLQDRREEILERIQRKQKQVTFVTRLVGTRSRDEV